MIVLLALLAGLASATPDPVLVTGRVVRVVDGDTLAVGAPSEDSAAQGLDGDQESDAASMSGDHPLFASGQFQSGNLYWTVLVVQRDPYLRLTAPGAGEARYLVLSNSG